MQVQGAARGAGGAGVACGDQVGDGFGLCEVELAVEEGALAELAGACMARAERGAFGHDALEDDGTAVRLQFDDVLAGEARGRGEEQGDAVVEDFIAGTHAHVMRVSRDKRDAAQRFGDRAAARTGQAHHPDATGTGGGGDGDDGVGVR